ncbi:hypothetical protein, partial [Staphylococcus aureus]|uniref:hypothetical protein n=1 Tax=Staphylococcus aureus TaxID=1280 RepID=UPI00301CB760
PRRLGHGHETGRTGSLTRRDHTAAPAAMSNALAEYLSALDARDTRERAHEAYVNACEPPRVLHSSARN